MPMPALATRRPRVDPAPAEPPSYPLALTPPRGVALPLERHAEMIGALECRDGIALEVAGRGGEGVRFLARAPHPLGRETLAGHLRGAYPQGAVVPIDDPTDDPAIARPGENADACELRLAGPGHLPLRTAFGGDASHAMEGLLAKLRGLPPGVEALCQIILWPAPAGWGDAAEAALSAAAEDERRRHGGAQGDTAGA